MLLKYFRSEDSIWILGEEAVRMGSGWNWIRWCAMACFGVGRV
jgi:hypothetical protein